MAGWESLFADTMTTSEETLQPPFADPPGPVAPRRRKRWPYGDRCHPRAGARLRDRELPDKPERFRSRAGPGAGGRAPSFVCRRAAAIR